jgi:cytoskeletal protein CcmA (bactofilin family)
LQTGSHIEGDIHTHRLVIDEGVFFEGSCKMGSSNEVDSKPVGVSQSGSNVTGAVQKPREKVTV